MDLSSGIINIIVLISVIAIIIYLIGLLTNFSRNFQN